jgi:APA family basic amino acid/polyamine antiporter
MMNKLPSTLGLSAAISIVVGILIGSGIFMKPATMAAQLGSPELLIAVWVVAGIITLFGALSSAEVTTMMPETGGQYVYFKHMYGDFMAFLFGWSAFAVMNTAGVASIAYVFGSYVQYFVELPRLDTSVERSIDLYMPFIGHIYPLENIGVKGVTIALVILLTYINYRSTSFGGKVLVLFTALKVVAIFLVIVTIFTSSSGSFSNFTFDAPGIPLTGIALIGGIVAAFSGAFWAYDGWINVSYVSGEIRNPNRSIPLSLLFGTLICMAIYVLINLAFLYVLPIDAMAGAPLVASDAVQVVLGSIGGGIIAVLVLLATFSSTHGNVMATSRVTFAMANNRHFFSAIGKVHPRYQTPANAVWLHGIVSSLFVLSGTFDTLTDMVIFISWVFYGLTALGIFVLRRKMPDHPRPYRVWGYPIVPAIYCIVTFFFLVLTLVNDINNYVTGKSVIINSVFAIAITLVGVPLYFYFKKRSAGSTNE